LFLTLTIAAALAPLPAAGPPLVDPPSLSSRSGRLDVELTAAPGEHRIGDQRFAGMLYQGLYIPPVWRVRPGDTLAVTLVNRLAEPTNLHFHGLRVSPRGHGDNVFVHVPPGGSFAYQIHIPRDHDPGLYWFHTHAHGLVSRQIIAGLSGALIIGGIERRFPMLHGMREHVLLIKHIPGARADWDELVTVDGQVAPEIDIRPGERQFWRIGNIGADLFVNLRLEDGRLYVVATDGHPHSRPTVAKDILLGPGQRVEAIVVGPLPGRYDLRSEPLILEEGRPPLPERRLAVLVSSGPPADIPAAARDIEAARTPPAPALSALRRSPVRTRRTFVFTRSMDRMRFYINGKLFGDADTTVSVPLGSVESWTIRNEDNQLHNFHIHQTAFLVTEIDGVPQSPDHLMDTITVPAEKNGVPGSITVKIPFTDPTTVGRFVFHCHVAKHEDKGMMQTIELTAAGRSGRHLADAPRSEPDQHHAHREERGHVGP
jgi:FtsP/CotA-like multicopper oxidase with cupredoxin domain